MAATRGAAALVPTTAFQPPSATSYAAMPPPWPDENSAAAETSAVARCEVQLAKWFAPNAVWNAGIGYSVLHPLPAAPPCAPSFQTTSE